MILLIIYINKK